MLCYSLPEHQAALDTLLAKRFPQRELMGTDQFAKYLQARDIPISPKGLHIFHERGLLLPLLHCRAPLESELADGPDGAPEDDPTRTDGTDRPVRFPSGPGALAWLRDHPKLFEERSQVPIASNEPPTDWVYYHPAQVFSIHKTWQVLEFREVVLDWPSDGPDFLSNMQEQTDGAIKDIVDAQTHQFRMLDLVMAIEDLYFPEMIRSVHCPGFEPQEWETWMRACRRDGVAPVLEHTGHDLQRCRRMRQHLVYDARAIDPAADLRYLIRCLAYGERDRLTGAARLAWDYYDLCDMLGLFLRDITGENQPDVDELHGSLRVAPFFEQRKGMLDYESAETRAIIARHYGLAAWGTFYWVVEGETEVAFLTEYMRALGYTPESVGIRLHNVGGLNRSAGDRLLQSIVKAAKREGAGVLLTADNEKGIDRLEKLVKCLLGSEPVKLAQLDEAHLLPVGILVWPSNFEDANFPTEELFEAWLALFTVDAQHQGVSTDPHALRRRFGEWRVENPGSTGRAAVDRFAQTAFGEYNKVAIAEELARRLAGSIGGDSSEPEKFIQKLLRHVQYASYRLRAWSVEYGDDGPSAGRRRPPQP